MKNRLIIILSTLFLLSSCNDILNIEPDGRSTLEKVFQDPETTAKYLSTCYNNLPQKDIGITSGIIFLLLSAMKAGTATMPKVCKSPNSIKETPVLTDIHLKNLMHQIGMVYIGQNIGNKFVSLMYS